MSVKWVSVSKDVIFGGGGGGNYIICYSMNCWTHCMPWLTFVGKVMGSQRAQPRCIFYTIYTRWLQYLACLTAGWVIERWLHHFNMASVWLQFVWLKKLSHCNFNMASVWLQVVWPKVAVFTLIWHLLNCMLCSWRTTIIPIWRLSNYTRFVTAE